MTNAGYLILMDELYEGNNGVALGRKETKYGTEWVTWGFTESLSTNEPRSYYWGHYFSNEKVALKDYHERLLREYERMV